MIQRYEIIAVHDDISVYQHEHGEWVRFDDLPKPSPWMDKPDSKGWWWYATRSNGHLPLSDQFWYLRTEQILSGMIVADGRSNGTTVDQFIASESRVDYCGKWKRIPDEHPPTEQPNV